MPWVYFSRKFFALLLLLFSLRYRARCLAHNWLGLSFQISHLRLFPFISSVVVLVHGLTTTCLDHNSSWSPWGTRSPSGARPQSCVPHGGDLDGLGLRLLSPVVASEPSTSILLLFLCPLWSRSSWPDQNPTPVGLPQLLWPLGFRSQGRLTPNPSAFLFAWLTFAGPLWHNSDPINSSHLPRPSLSPALAPRGCFVHFSLIITEAAPLQDAGCWQACCSILTWALSRRLPHGIIMGIKCPSVGRVPAGSFPCPLTIHEWLHFCAYLPESYH